MASAAAAVRGLEVTIVIKCHGKGWVSVANGVCRKLSVPPKLMVFHGFPYVFYEHDY